MHLQLRINKVCRHTWLLHWCRQLCPLILPHMLYCLLFKISDVLRYSYHGDSLLTNACFFKFASLVLHNVDNYCQFRGCFNRVFILLHSDSYHSLLSSPSLPASVWNSITSGVCLINLRRWICKMSLPSRQAKPSDKLNPKTIDPVGLNLCWYRLLSHESLLNSVVVMKYSVQLR